MMCNRICQGFLAVYSLLLWNVAAFNTNNVQLMKNGKTFNHPCRTQTMLYAKEIELAFFRVTSIINSSANDVKQMNIELATRGKQFVPYNQHFDYSTLFENSSCDDIDCRSLWKRDNNASQNLEDLLRVAKFSDYEIEEIVASNQGTVQSFLSQEVTKTSTNPLEGDQQHYSIKIIEGIDVFKNIVRHIATINVGSMVEVKSRWQQNEYITEAMIGDEVFFQTKRKLELDDCINMFQDDRLTMKVSNTFIPSVIFEDCDSENISILEVYKRHYFYKDSADSEIKSSRLERVPGCIANVNVRTILVSKEDESYELFIDGEADAIIARGLLWTLQNLLNGLNVQDVMKIEPSNLAENLKLRNVLSEGRNDGLANMMAIIQAQAKTLLSGAENEDQEIVDTNEDKEKRPTVAMLLSGGVDSSVAMNLLVREGYDVTAFYLKIWLEDELAHLGQCPWEDDFNVCTQICEQAGVPLEAISLQNEYKDKVISYTIGEAVKGRTPNPDIMCNSRVKFGCFYDSISKRDFDFVATGHYAQLQEAEDGSKRLMRAPDPVKDQSYFLAALTQEQLKRVLFPIGQFQKSRVRELAQEFDLPNKNRPDSQGLCFLGKVKFDEFLAEYLGEDPGDIIDTETNEVIGRHNGIWYHTVGQRKGLGKVLNPLATSRGPWYVVAKDTKLKHILASNKYDEEKYDQTRKEFSVEDIQWITKSPPSDLLSGSRLTMKIRHGPNIVEGILKIDENSADEGRIILDKKDGGLAPGQFVVFYNDIECLGSAVISEKHWLTFLNTESSSTLSMN